MAKYRITSIPQSLPKAQNGGLKKLSTNIQNFVYPRLHPRGNKKTAPVVNEPMTEVQGVQENPMWNDMLSSVDKGETCPPGKYPYNDENGNWTGQCLTESEYQVATDKDFEDWDNKWDKKFNPIIQSIQDERRKLRTEDSDRRRNDYDESAKTYYETFNKSKKGDKIKPFQSLPTSVTDSKTPVIDEEGNPVLGEDGQPLMESFENQLKNKYLVIKNDRGFTDLYPKDIVHNRILKNGFQADQFVNYWGLDRKQVEEQMGPLMEGAMENYTSEVTQSVVKKAVNEGKTTDQVISELSPKVGTKTGLKTKFAEPTKKIVDDVYAQVQEDLVNSLSGPTKSSWLDDNTFLSDNPVAAFEKSKTSMTNPGEYLGYIKNKYERGDKEYNKYKKDPKNNYDPNYTYANIDDQFADMRSQVAAKKRVDYEVGAQEARKKGELTEFNDAAGKYISNLSANDLKYFINQALTKTGTTQAGKLDILNTVQNNPEKIYSKLLELESDEKVNGKTQTYSDLFSDAANTSFGVAAKHNKENIKNGNGINENTSGNKLRDVLKYPLDALYFAANPNEEMWGDSNLSYDTKLDIQKEKGVDLGVMGNDNPLSILRNFTTLQAFNPFKIGMNLRKGYDQGRLLGAVADELVDMGTSYGLGKGFNALGNLKYANRMAAGNNLLGSGLKNTIGLKKGLGTVLSGFNNPLMNLGMLASVPENIKDVKDEFEAGNYTSAALNALFAYWGAKPAFNTFKNLNALRKPGTVLSNPNFNTQYTGLYDAATPGSGIALGHPGLHTAEPVFKSITNPLNKLGKGLGFGEFSILKQNQGLNTQPVNHSIDRLPSNFNRKNGPGISPIMRSMSKPKSTVIKTDVPKVDLTKYRNSSGGKSAIRYGNEPHPGEEWYNIDPADYDTNWKEEGLTNASNSLKKYLLNSPEHGPDLFKGVGEFKFKDLSDGWAARNAMMNMASDPQKMLGDNDFFSPSAFKNFLTNQKKWEVAKSQFDEMNPEDPATAMWSTFSGNHERDELFSNLFPNVFLPNFRSKFTTPEQESFLRESDLENFTIPKRNALSKVSLNALSKNNNSTDKLPRSYQDLINASKDNFLNTSPVKDVVIEMRGVLGLKIEDIQNATPEQLEKWRQKIITNMNKQKFDRWKYDISVPFTGGNAYKQISDVPGYKNKKGGIVTSLSKKEIDQYVKDGYIIEDH